MKKTHYGSPRRDFLTKSAAAAFGFNLLPSYLATGRAADGRKPPSQRINLACIGVGGRATGVIPGVCSGGHASPVAFCDVDFKSRRVDANLKKFPGTRQFKDFRVMFDKMTGDIDAVTVVTPDHTHFPAAMLAMSLGKHVYVEKPLTHSYREADLLMKAERKFKVVTQMGNQGHTSGGSEQFRHWVERGIVKDITRIDAWKTPSLWFMNAKERISEFPPAEQAPASMDWDLWCGPAEMKPFSSKYHPFNWRAFHLYGNGMLGDWGAHIIDFAHDFLKLGQPTRIAPLLMDDHNRVIFPLSSHLRMNFPQRGELPPVELTWRDGADCHPHIHETFWDNGKAPKLGGAGTVLFSGDGKLAITRASHSSTSTIIPAARAKEFGDRLKTPNPEHNHQTGFTQACLGNAKTMSPFSIAGDLTKTLMLGVVCQYLNEALEFDRGTERFRNNARANALLDGPEPRQGWGDFYQMA